MSLDGRGFSSGESPLHLAEQRTKIVSAVVLTLATATVQTMSGAVLAFMIGALLTAGAHLSPKRVFLALAPANSFFLFLLVTLPWTYPGEPWPRFPAVSQDGVQLALLIAIKGNAIMLMVFALLATSTMTSLANGFYGLGIPQKLVLLLCFVHRQAFLSMQEVERMRMAAEARCFTSRLNGHTLKTYAHIVAQTLLRGLDRSERIHHAMLMRGFDGRFHYLFPIPRIQLKDLALGSSALGMATLIVLFDIC